MDGNRRQAYDRGQTIFSPDGRLYQVEYAREAVERGSPAVGVRSTEGLVLAARKRLASPLLEADSVAKLHRVDDHLTIASAGHAADARQLVERARLEAQRHRLRYGEPAPVDSVTTDLADHVQESTQTGGTRPFGAALLVAGVNPSGKAGPSAADGHLYEVDPSGTPYGWRAVGIGDGADAIRDRLETELASAGAEGTLTVEEGALTLEDAMAAALDGLAVGDEALDPAAYECLTVEPGPTITRRTSEEIASSLPGAAS